MAVETAVVPEDKLLDNEFEMMNNLKLLVNTGAAGDPGGRGPLWHSWRFLQIYSNWGLKMPYVQAQLAPRLGMKNPGAYQFFPLMLDSYGIIHKASKDFQTDAFPAVIKVGRSILDYAKDARLNNESVFDLLIELVDTNQINDAKEVVGDLQKTARQNAERAEFAELKLNGFSADLTESHNKMLECTKLIEADSATSQSTIDLLTGGPEVKGSIQNLKKLLAEKQKEYDHAVVVASTTLSYAWVYPFGPIAAVIVAGVYGDRAVKALEEVNRQTAKLEGENQKLFTAIEAHRCQDMSYDSITGSKSVTARALDNVGIVKNAWSGILGSLAVVEKKVNDMSSGSDDGALKAKAIVKNYARSAGAEWAKLIDPLTDLTDKPYLSFEDGEKPLKDFINDVKEVKESDKELIGAK